MAAAGGGVSCLVQCSIPWLWHCRCCDYVLEMDSMRVELFSTPRIFSFTNRTFKRRVAAGRDMTKSSHTLLALDRGCNSLYVSTQVQKVCALPTVCGVLLERFRCQWSRCDACWTSLLVEASIGL